MALTLLRSYVSLQVPVEEFIEVLKVAYRVQRFSHVQIVEFDEAWQRGVSRDKTHWDV